MQEQRQRPPVWALILVTFGELAGTGLLVWSQMAPQEREWMILAIRSRCRSVGGRLGVRAYRVGRAGMAEELAGKDPSARYLAAAWLRRHANRLEQI